MSENHQTTMNESSYKEPVVPAFGYELIREFLLAELLGKDAPLLLYWAGKQLARKFPLTDTAEIFDFFDNAGWGNLQLVKESKEEMLYQISGELITRRFNVNEECNFQLEAGFIAQQIEQQKKLMTETYEERKPKANKVLLTVKWDSKDILS